MRKVFYAVALVIFTMVLLASTAKAELQISVTVKYAVLSPLQTQTIMADTNLAGWGIVFVVQPSDGAPWTNFVTTSSNPLLYYRWTYLQDSIKTQVNSEIGGKIVSYRFTDTALTDGWTFELAYPTNFIGINGVPSTAAPGAYKVIFVFWNSGTICVTKFDCGSWLVVPQVPLGTVMALVGFFSAIPAFVLYKRKHLT